VQRKYSQQDTFTEFGTPQNSFVRSKEHGQQRNGVKGVKQLLNSNANLKKKKEYLRHGCTKAAALSQMANTNTQTTNVRCAFIVRTL